jgi:hypothetical protein
MTDRATRLHVHRRPSFGFVVGTVIAFAGMTLCVSACFAEPVLPSGPATMRLISASQYAAAIHDVFGEDIKLDVAIAPPQREHGLLALGASSAAITPGTLEQFVRVARDVAKQVTSEDRRDLLIACQPATADDACTSQFFKRVGRLLYRRPLTLSELEATVHVSEEAGRQLGDYYGGVGHALAGMLTSPKFLYVSESTEPDPDRPGQLRLDSYARATRLSLLLWDAPPDEVLLDAAAKGELYKSGGLKRQIDRMLASPRLTQGVRAFFSDLLTFERFDTLAKDPTIYPAFTSAIARSSKEQVLQVITHELLTRNSDYRDLFTTPSTLINGDLGAFYKAPVATSSGWAAYDGDPQKNVGLLTSPGLLALYSHPGRSSPTRRGRAIRELLLCQSVPDPPPNVSFELFNDPNQHFTTARERLEAHRTNPVCGGCHKITDPIGLALENFDGAGQYRNSENGAPIDASGELSGHTFKNVSGLGQAIRADPALTSCLVTRLFSYAVGRPTARADSAWLAYMTQRFAADGYRFRELLRQITTSSAFYAVSADTDTAVAKAD